MAFELEQTIMTMNLETLFTNILTHIAIWPAPDAVGRRLVRRSMPA
jgi:hypothetical protein